MSLSEGNTMGTNDERVTNGFPPRLETAIVRHLHSMSHGGIFCNTNTECMQKKPCLTKAAPRARSKWIKGTEEDNSCL